MEMLNIKHGNQVQQLRYDYDSGVYSFEKDIQIGDWTVSRFIKIGGPKGGSIYKYDFKNFFEFVIGKMIINFHIIFQYLNNCF